MAEYTYQPSVIEPKWQEVWAKRRTFRTPSDPEELRSKPDSTAELKAFTMLVDWVARTLGGTWRTILGFVNILRHFDDFSKGIFDTRAVIFFLSATAFFLFLAVKVLESRRWR